MDSNGDKLKRCNLCRIEKPLTGFYKIISTSVGFRPRCKECLLKRMRERYRDNPKVKKDYYNKHIETKLEYSRRWREEHAEKIKQTNAVYYKKNKNQIIKQHLGYYRNRRLDVEFRLRRRICGRLRRFVRREAIPDPIILAIGCDIDFLKKWIESKFQKGMSWQNWGNKGWHIDHIKPLCKFNLYDPKQLIEASHYTNLQPLWARDNIVKGGRYAKEN